MDLSHIHAPGAFACPELVFVCIFAVLLVELFQFITVSSVPDPVADRMALEVQHFIDLEIIWICRDHIQPAPDCLFNILIQFIHPFHLFVSSVSNPIILRYGIQPYCWELIVWSFRSSGISFSSSQEYFSNSAM